MTSLPLVYNKPPIYNMDSLDFLDECNNYGTIIADPPDNLGLKYNTYIDKIPNYYDWLELVILKALLKTKTLWLSIYYKHELEMSYRIRNIIKYRHPSFSVRKIIWRFTFGQYNDNELSNGYRPIFLITRDELNWDAIRVESDRMAIGDSRASGPRIPDDVWEFSRVVGNAKERCPWHPTQHPTVLYSRMVKVSNPPFVDIFGGTGTIFRAKLDSHYVDIDPDYCETVFNTYFKTGL